MEAKWQYGRLYGSKSLNTSIARKYDKSDYCMNINGTKTTPNNEKIS